MTDSCANMLPYVYITQWSGCVVVTDNCFVIYTTQLDVKGKRTCTSLALTSTSNPYPGTKLMPYLPNINLRNAKTKSSSAHVELVRWRLQYQCRLQPNFLLLTVLKITEIMMDPINVKIIIHFTEDFLVSILWISPWDRLYYYYYYYYW